MRLYIWASSAAITWRDRSGVALWTRALSQTLPNVFQIDVPYRLSMSRTWVRMERSSRGKLRFRYQLRYFSPITCVGVSGNHKHEALEFLCRNDRNVGYNLCLLIIVCHIELDNEALNKYDPPAVYRYFRRDSHTVTMSTAPGNQSTVLSALFRLNAKPLHSMTNQHLTVDKRVIHFSSLTDLRGAPWCILDLKVRDYTMAG